MTDPAVLFDLLRRLYAADGAIALTDVGLRFVGARPPDDLLQELKSHRAAMLDLLRAHDIGAPVVG